MTTTGSRYARLFSSASEDERHVVMPYFTTGDPSPERFLDIVDAAVEAGAAGFELGIAFSDPSADGPANQDAMNRVLSQGIGKARAFELIAEVRRRHPGIPIGLLVYANLVYRPDVASFYSAAAGAGVDSVLVADVPCHHIHPFSEAAGEAGLQTVLIAPPNATQADLAEIAATSEGYVYVVARAGVTGVDRPADTPLDGVLSALKRHGAPPAIVAFGVSKPEHVRHAVAAGAAGVICGSVYSNLIAEYSEDLDRLVAEIGRLTSSLVNA